MEARLYAGVDDEADDAAEVVARPRPLLPPPYPCRLCSGRPVPVATSQPTRFGEWEREYWITNERLWELGGKKKEIKKKRKGRKKRKENKK
jgi:hypothetical protein